MFTTIQSSPAFASTGASAMQAQAGWSSDMDDVAFGCECADPALQIDSWGQETMELSQPGASAP